jgi:argonaute-like protein implicated in RNA metabolism and viral defense
MSRIRKFNDHFNYDFSEVESGESQDMLKQYLHKDIYNELPVAVKDILSDVRDNNMDEIIKLSNKIGEYNVKQETPELFRSVFSGISRVRTSEEFLSHLNKLWINYLETTYL